MERAWGEVTTMHARGEDGDESGRNECAREGGEGGEKVDMGSGCVKNVGNKVEDDEVGEVVCEDDDGTGDSDARAGCLEGRERGVGIGMFLGNGGRTEGRWREKGIGERERGFNERSWGKSLNVEGEGSKRRGEEGHL